MLGFCVRFAIRNWAGIAAILISAVVALSNLSAITERPLPSDEHQNARMAYHLVTSGVISYASEPEDEVVPTMRREPVPIVALALFYLAHPQLSSDLPLSEVTEGGHVVYVKQINIIWAFLIFAGTFALSLSIFENRLVAFPAALLAICASRTMFIYPATNGLLTEVPAAAFLVLASAAMLNFSRRRTLLSAVILGVALGLLALTKSVFFYISFVALPLLAIHLWIRHRGDGQADARAMLVGRPVAEWVRLPIIAASVFVLLCGIWMTRNFVHFGQFTIGERGGDVLAFRLLEMEVPIGGAIYAWSPREYRPWVGEITGYRPGDLEPGGVLAVMNRANGPVALHRQRWRIYRARMEAAGEPYRAMSRAEREGWLGREAIKTYAADPGHYAIWVGAYAYRGSFAGANRLKALRDVNRALPEHVVFLLFATFLIVGIVGVLRFNSTLLPIFLLPVGLYFFNAMLTHNIPRYNEPLIPFLWLAGVIALRWIIGAGPQLWRSATSALKSAHRLRVDLQRRLTTHMC